MGMLVGCAPPAPAETPTVTTPELIVTPTGTLDPEEALASADRELLAEHYLEAARLYELVAQHSQAETRWPRALFGLGESLDRAAQPEAALAAYGRYAALGVPAEARQTARVRMVRLLTFLERYAEAETLSQKVTLGERAPLEQVALLAARALGALERDDEETAARELSAARQVLEPFGIEHVERVPLDVAAWSYGRGELLRRQAARVGFDPLPSDFSATLERRCQLLLDAQAAYSDAMRAGSAHYSAMAGVRVGQLYKDLHQELTHLPYPPSADTPARRALVEGALRLRYSVLLDSAAAMLKSTVALVERTGEGASWAERAKAALAELEEARVAEEKALAALPYSRAQLEEALRKLGESAATPQGPRPAAGPKAGRPLGDQ